MWGAVVLMGEMSEIGELDAAFVTLTWVNERVQEAEVEREKGGRESARARERERARAREREREIYRHEAAARAPGTSIRFTAHMRPMPNMRTYTRGCAILRTMLIPGTNINMAVVSPVMVVVSVVIFSAVPVFVVVFVGVGASGCRDLRCMCLCLYLCVCVCVRA